MRGAIEGPSWSSFDYKVDIASTTSMGSRKYIRSVNVAGDIKTYDVGTLYVATIGQDNTDAVGKLFVDYDVEFFNPIIVNPTLSPKCYSQFDNQAAPTLYLDNVFLHVQATVPTVNSMQIVQAPPGVFNVPAGTYRFSCEFTAVANGGAKVPWELIWEFDGAFTAGTSSYGTLYAADRGMLVSTAYHGNSQPFTASCQVRFQPTDGTLWEGVQGSVRISIHCV
jgi:hypothetical protein